MFTGTVGSVVCIIGWVCILLARPDNVEVSLQSGVKCLIARLDPVFSLIARLDPVFSFGANSNDALRSGVIAGASVWAFTEIGAAFDQSGGFWETNGAGHIGAHALTGGVLSKIQGGKFGHGFISAGLTKGLTPTFSGVDAFEVGNISVAQMVIAATLGGTISKITGGKFANGATTAAFANVFNQQRSEHMKRQTSKRRIQREQAELQRRRNSAEGSGFYRPQNQNHIYTVGRPDHPFVYPGNEGPGLGKFIEDNFRAGHTFGANHDRLVGFLVNEVGLSDVLVNIPTMVPVYAVSLVQETINAPFRVFDDLFYTNVTPFQHSDSK